MQYRLRRNVEEIQKLAKIKNFVDGYWFQSLETPVWYSIIRYQTVGLIRAMPAQYAKLSVFKVFCKI